MNFVAIGVFFNFCTAYVSDMSPLTIRASGHWILQFITVLQSFYLSYHVLLYLAVGQRLALKGSCWRSVEVCHHRIYRATFHP
jgi:hypothetical protein